MGIATKSGHSAEPTEYSPDAYPQEVLLFASLRDVAGENFFVHLQAGSTVEALLNEIKAVKPELLLWLPYVRVAVNCEYATTAQILCRGDEIALLPPVSGGAERAQTAPSGIMQILVTDQPLDAAAIISTVSHDAIGGAGAVVPFIGIVRDNARGQTVTHLEYHAYGAMAEAEMGRIAAEAHGRWNCLCALVHRTGSLQIGEASLVVVVAAAHRAEAFEACRWIVDEIKVRVPVWKKEYAANGTFWIEDPVNSKISGDSALPVA